MLSILGIASIALTVYTYFGYPVVLLLLRIFIRREKSKLSEDVHGVSIIIACRNEENVIAEKIENTLSLKWKQKSLKQALKDKDNSVQVIVASDASDDSTHLIVEAYSELGIELISLSERQGKEAAQKKALNFANNEIILFTDAKVVLDDDALNVLTEYFRDSSIGAVSSCDRVVDEKGQSGEGSYVKYEMFVRDLESNLYSLIGLSGSCFAVRKELTSNFPTSIPSDFCMLIETRKQGFRGVSARDLVAQYAAVNSPLQEFDRKVRTVLRGMASVWHYRNELIINNDKLFLFQIISHKLLRWAVPFLIICSFISSLAFCFDSLFWLIIFLAHILLFGLWFKGHLDPDSRNNIIVKICFFFVLTNYSILIAWFRFLRGDRQVLWNPSQKG